MHTRDDGGAPRHAGLIDTPMKAVKKRKLTVGQIVVARKRSGEDEGEGGRKWQPAKVINVDGQGRYRYRLTANSTACDRALFLFHFAGDKTLVLSRPVAHTFIVLAPCTLCDAAMP